MRGSGREGHQAGGEIPELRRDLIRDHMRRKSTTAAAVAESCGITSATLSRYLSGQRQMPAPVLLRLCRELSLSPWDVYKDLDSRP